MPIIEIERQEAETGALPPVCMRCGRPAHCRREKYFKQSGLRHEVQTWLIAPLCDAHRNHWFWRDLLIPLSFFTMVVLCCAGPGFLPKEDARTGMLAAVGAMLIWAVVALTAHMTTIRPKRITSTHLVLKGVCTEFIGALMEHRLHPKNVDILKSGAMKRRVALFRWEIEKGLPAVCMRCGQPATEWREKIFEPQSIAGVFGLLAWIACDAGLRSGRQPSFVVRTPLCSRHRYYWQLRPLFLAGGLLGYIGLAILLLLVLSPLLSQKAVGGICSASFFGFFAWLILMIVLYERAIQPEQFAAHGLTLKNVAEPFAAEVERQRRDVAEPFPVDAAEAAPPESGSSTDPRFRSE